MTLKDARSAEAEGQLVAAARFYEDALSANPHQVDALIDLVLLYWQASDYGVWQAKGLDLAFVKRAGARFQELLARGRTVFPNHPAVLFWSRYIAWAEFGEAFERDECRALLRAQSDYLEPALFLFATSHGAECEPEARALLDACKEVRTSRCRYIVSVIGPVFKRTHSTSE